MKKLNKINARELTRIENEIRNSGPTFRIFDNELSLDRRNSNESIIRDIEEYLKEIDFNESTIFETPLSEDDTKDSSRWLGSYRSMRSPGIITLYISNLKGFAWYVTKELIKRDHYIDLDVFNQIVYNIVRKTVYHELFHHYLQ